MILFIDGSRWNFVKNYDVVSCPWAKWSHSSFFKCQISFFQIQRFLFVSLYMAIYAIFGYIGLSLVMHK